ncbi:MAG: orotate phosphoribosyltransferase [Nevskiaceae bacterium]|nr:MAG: orotate phosphoribosyltransferase [Nevskiaceae bacterium]TBR72752.1 MAG: orotate phosphoribosyltransferase [Nevskiaceae bacterium]
MQAYQRAFLKLALAHDVLRFGAFTLKSGRTSPYFFNLGRISTGNALRTLAAAYADAILATGVAFDLVFGPAYKGIPLAAAVSVALAERGRDVAFAYNRKEAKDHGEGGLLVGADVAGQRVLIIDDVLTAGTALRQSIALLRGAGAQPVAAFIALDRQECGAHSEISAVDELKRETGIAVHAIADVGAMLEYLGAAGGDPRTVAAIHAYQQQYGAQR